MPSPVLPSEFLALISGPDTPLCDAFKNATVNFIPKFYEFYNWAFNADGTLSQAFIDEINANADTLPTGSIIFFPGPVTDIPSGYVVANGAAYNGNLESYADLWALYGNMHGGTGITDFRVPNLINSFLEGNYTAGQIGKINERLFISLASGEFDGTTDTITEEYVDFFDRKNFLHYEKKANGGLLVDSTTTQVCYIRGFHDESDGILRITHNWGNSRVKVSLKLKVKYADTGGVYSVNEEIDLSPGFYLLGGSITANIVNQFIENEVVSSISVAAPTATVFPLTPPNNVSSSYGGEITKSQIFTTILNAVEEENIINLSVGINAEYFSLPTSGGELAWWAVDNLNVRGNLIIELKRIATFENDYSFLNSLKAIPLVKL